MSVLAGLLINGSYAVAQEGPPGITEPTVFPAFHPDAPQCSPPPGLTPVLAYVQENDREFLEGVNHGLSLAAADRGLEYRRVLASSDRKVASGSTV